MATLYSNCTGEVTVGCVLYSAGGVPVPNGYYYSGSTYFLVGGGAGVIAVKSSFCPPPYTTFTLAQSFISGSQACTDYPTTNTNQYYAAVGATLTTGTIIYTDTALTTPAANAFYSNSVNYWNTGANSGNLQNQTAC